MSLRERIASLMGRVRPELAELVAIRSVAELVAYFGPIVLIGRRAVRVFLVVLGHT